MRSGIYLLLFSVCSVSFPNVDFVKKKNIINERTVCIHYILWFVPWLVASIFLISDYHPNTILMSKSHSTINASLIRWKDNTLPLMPV